MGQKRHIVGTYERAATGVVKAPISNESDENDGLCKHMSVGDIDLDLVKRIKEGDEIAFEQLFNQYRSYAYALIYKITGVDGEHEDLLQEVFFQTYLSIKKFRGDSLFKTWFHRIVINTCTARWRHLQAAKRPSPQDTYSMEVLPYELAQKNTCHATAFENRSFVNKALNILSENIKITIILDVYCEFTMAEIAHILEIPEGTVKSRIYMARRQIKEYLESLNGREQDEQKFN